MTFDAISKRGDFMADREKVIKGLQVHADGCGYRSHHCDVMECPYRYGDESCDIEEMCHDALELLKKQQPVKVKVRFEHSDNKCFDHYKCPSCGSTDIYYEQRYCDDCGTALDWSEIT